MPPDYSVKGMLLIVKIISFIGRHNSGKTTLLRRVIEKLRQTGFKVAVIKHTSHVLDTDGEHDSDLLFSAGAEMVCAVSPALSIHYLRHEREPDLQEILTQIPLTVDLIITEGYKKEAYPKIEVLRQVTGIEFIDAENIIARVSDFTIDDDLPCFNFEEIEELCRFIISL
jgi:molybdopterin-guanine dinucleotide biosynthesis protein B